MTAVARRTLSVAWAAAAGSLLLLGAPLVTHADPRIRSVTFAPDKITGLNAYPDYEMMVAFDKAEHIENVAVGKSADWEIAPNKAGDGLFLKPLAGAVRTNMTVVTSARTYLFELVPHDVGELRPGSVTYLVRFVYPENPSPSVSPAPLANLPAAVPPRPHNVNYTFAGSRALLPAEVFDDGHFTYFRWPQTAAIPAIFAISPDGAESLVNHVLQDGFEVVQQLGLEFRLRDGSEVTTVVNEAYHPPEAGPGAPRQHQGPLPIPERRGDL